jgi:hypothetical protein
MDEPYQTPFSQTPAQEVARRALSKMSSPGRHCDALMMTAVQIPAALAEMQRLANGLPSQIVMRSDQRALR